MERDAAPDEAELCSRFYVADRPLYVSGMNTVWLGWDRSRRCLVILKLARPDNPESMPLLGREAATLQKCAHPRVQQFAALGKRGGAVCLVTDYVEGKTLHEVLDESCRPLRADEIVRPAATFLEGLGEVHRNGYLHRDIKPENVVWAPDGWTLIDFGIAVPIGYQDPRQDRLVTGTPETMSPEQCLNDPLDGRSDLYSVGVVLYEMLTMSLPFPRTRPGEMLLAHIASPPRPFADVMLEGLPPPAVEAVVMRALAKNPDDRFDSAADMAAALRAALG